MSASGQTLSKFTEVAVYHDINSQFHSKEFVQKFVAIFALLIFFFTQERWGYICPDIAKEFAKYEAEPTKWIKKYESVNAVTKKVLNLNQYSMTSSNSYT